MDKKPTQCCYCKSNSDNEKYIKFFNLEEGKISYIAYGCSSCKDYQSNEEK